MGSELSTCWNVIATFVFLTLLLYVTVRRRYAYWKDRGIFSPEATFPTGHMGDAVLGRTHMASRIAELYLAHKNKPHVGLYMMTQKAWMVNDMELIKAVLVKDFAHFTDHSQEYNKRADPLSHHLFNMIGDEWREFRVKLTPTFTSSKMKFMYGTFYKCTAEMIAYLEERVQQEIDFKEVLAMYGTDVIGSCAFGIEINSFKDPKAKFRQMGKKIFDIGFVKALKFTLLSYAPSLFKKLGIRLVSREEESFFTRIVEENIEQRLRHNIARNDFLQILLNMKLADEKNGEKYMTNLEITAQVYLFFQAGFETSSATASFAMYEIAKNTHVQTILYNEIKDTMKKHGGVITYDSLLEMKYLDQVIEETLRMYPPLPFLFRVCTKEYTIPKSTTTIEKGTLVIIPAWGIHMDPAIYKDPHKFDPDRYSAENKRNLPQYASLGFGEGPRKCIGNRFGMMQTRLGIASILSKFEISFSKKTPIPLKVAPTSFILAMSSGTYLKISRRSNCDNTAAQ